MILTRQTAIPVLSVVTVALITSTVRDLPTEVQVGRAHGVDHECVINCDNIVTVSKGALRRYRGHLERAQPGATRQASEGAIARFVAGGRVVSFQTGGPVALSNAEWPGVRLLVTRRARPAS